MKVGLVLSGGGARGISHLGILEALTAQGFKYDIVSGVSAGAIAGAFLCKGYHPREVLEIIQKTSLFKTMRPAFSWRSLLSLEGAKAELIKYFPENSFESLQIPFRVTTTDIGRGKVKVYKKGELITPILASCAIPVIFEPIRIRSRVLVDGEVMDNLPVEPIRKKVDRVVALHCNPIDAGFIPSTWKGVLERANMITISQLAYTAKGKCDLFLEPPGLSKFNVFDFNKAKDIFDFGYEYAQREIEKGILKEYTSP